MRLQRRKSAISGLNPEQELKAWRVYFSYGADYFSDLKAFGINIRSCPKDVRIEKAAEAWNPLGSTFLSTWIPRPGRQEPWALSEFGDPE